jgi:hypothetical protein
MVASDELSAGSTSLIIRSDVRGRVLTPRARREALLAEFDRSGVSATRFAELSGIKYQTFAGWLHCRRRKGQLPGNSGENAAPNVAWLEAVVRDGQSGSESSGLVLHLPGGVRAEITSSRHIGFAAALVRALEKPC